MSGGKETPRQKMIGMMYLVLTALLAMNVSASIMEKFAFLNNGMEQARDIAVTRNEGQISSIESIVNERGKKEKEVNIVNEAKEIRKRTAELLVYIEQIKVDIINKTGGLNADKLQAKVSIPVDMKAPKGMIPGAGDRDAVMVMLIGPDPKKGKGMELKSKIDDYIKYINEHSKTPHETFALDGKDDPMAKSNPEQAAKNFAELNFEETPAIAALAVLSQMQQKITKFESEVLAEKAGAVGASDFKFDIVDMMTKPESRIVAAGTKYKAEMFISATSSTLNPTMRWILGGKTNVIDPATIKGGIGSLEFRANGGAYDKDGRSKQKWVGEIEFKGPEGMVVVKDTVEYIVSKPVIQVQSASVSALYLNCGNELNIQVPALGEEYNPSFGVTGGTSIKGANKGFVTVVPTAPKVSISVSSGGSTIGVEEFKVRKIPLPTVKVLSNGKEIDFKKGVVAPGPRSLDIVAVPDASFKEFLPKDARYTIASGEVLLVRGKRPMDKAQIQNGKVNLSNFVSAARDGDRILIEIKSIKRKNFQDKVEEVTGMGAMIYNIPLTD